VVATDGSVRTGRSVHIGCAYLDDAGDWWMEWVVRGRRQPGTNLSLQAELRAIRNATTKHEHRVTVLSDCLEAVRLMERWQAGDLAPIPGYRGRTLINFARRVAQTGELFDVQWTRGHHGHALNEGADALARLASRRLKDGVPVRETRLRAAGIAAAFSGSFMEAVAA
jgi:ribonuclease HI